MDNPRQTRSPAFNWRGEIPLLLLLIGAAIMLTWESQPAFQTFFGWMIGEKPRAWDIFAKVLQVVGSFSFIIIHPGIPDRVSEDAKSLSTQRAESLFPEIDKDISQDPKVQAILTIMDGNNQLARETEKEATQGLLLDAYENRLQREHSWLTIGIVLADFIIELLSQLYKVDLLFMTAGILILIAAVVLFFLDNEFWPDRKQNIWNDVVRQYL
jgi:hypothetical protein